MVIKMPINNIKQPEIIEITNVLRLKKYDGSYEKALEGYRDPYVYRNSEGIFDADKIPDIEYIKGMFEYLDGAGELYFIEVLAGGTWKAIGDITVKDINPPIAIWEGQYRGRGIGTAVMTVMINRLKSLGYKRITGSIVYKWNTASQKMHEKLGFLKSDENEKEYIYSLEL